MGKERHVYKNGKRVEKTISGSRKTVLSINPFVRWFSRKKIDIALKMAGLKKEDVVLDFGCGDGYLKRTNPGLNITGYDINPEQTGIDDYRKIQPNKIFAMDVLEHIPKREIEVILKNFKNMSHDFDLIVAIPTENWISRKARMLMGKPERVRDHITSLKEILGILSVGFELREKNNFLTFTYIARFSSKDYRNRGI